MSILKSKIDALVGRKPLSSTNQQIGIEIEMEAGGAGFPETQVPGWTRHAEGSLLGNSVELVTQGVIDPTQALTFLDRVDTWLKDNSVRINDSVRAGVHIHVNTLDMTFQQALTMGALFYLFEESLVELGGAQRSGNLFCLRLKDASYPVFCLNKAITEESAHRWLANDNIRYAALNWNSLFKFGSVEYRFIRTPTSDFKQLDSWVRQLYLFKHLAMTVFKNPAEVLRTISSEGTENILRIALTPEFATRVKAIKGYEDQIWRGVRFVQDFAFEHEWEK